MIFWDEDRFAGSVYAIKDGITIARIVAHLGAFDVFPAPDASPQIKRRITKEGIETLDAAKKWIEKVADEA